MSPTDFPDEAKFPRLPHYFSEGLLNTASVVPSDRPPVPPLSALGLREFADFEGQPARGITYRDTSFLGRADAKDESLHFHELVHVVQWQVLGPDRKSTRLNSSHRCI